MVRDDRRQLGRLLAESSCGVSGSIASDRVPTQPSDTHPLLLLLLLDLLLGLGPFFGQSPLRDSIERV